MTTGLNIPSIRFKDATTLTIASGVVTVTQTYHIIAAETGTADDLATITNGFGDVSVNSVNYRGFVVIKADTGDTITVKHGTGNISLNGAADFSLSGNKQLLLLFDGTNWTDLGAGGGTGGGAPTDATYITQTANGTLSAEQALSSLSTGLAVVTNGTGVISTVAAPTGTVVGTSDTQTLTNKTLDADTNTFKNLGFRADGRLTLTSATPVTTSDVTAATTIYYTPYVGNLIALFDGTDWQNHEFTERSIAVPATTNTPYDVYIYDNAGTLTLELVAWTNDTTRATDIVRQDGVYVKTGETNKRYLGSFRTAGVSGQTASSVLRRYLQNYYNRVELLATQSYSIEHTYTTASFRAWNNNTTIGEARVEFFVGFVEDPITILGYSQQRNNSANGSGFTAFGLNTVSAGTTGHIFWQNMPTTAIAYGFASDFVAYPQLGLNYVNAVQLGAATSLTYITVASYTKIRG